MTIKRYLAVLACGFALCSGAMAEVYPQKPIVAVVPFPPGGSSDATMRTMSAKLSSELGQPVVIENKPGANGSIGAAQVARSKPDGYTILIGSVGTYAITPLLLKNVAYDPRRSFDLLTIATRTANVVVVPASLPVNTIGELVAYMKKNPGQTAFATSGIGSTDHLTSLLFWQKTGTSGVLAPYKGGGSAITDLLAGHVQVLITNISALSGHIKSGRLKALAVTSETRLAGWSQIPTLAEAGVSGLTTYSWQGIAAPKGLPRDVADKLRAALMRALKDPQVTKQLEGAGFEVVATSESEFAAQLSSEIARWKTVIDTAGIQAE